jgi:hypothetical protein
MPTTNGATAADAGTVDIGGDITVNRLGFGAMRITGRGIWGDPPDRNEARAVCAEPSSWASTSSTQPTRTAPT